MDMMHENDPAGLAEMMQQPEIRAEMERYAAQMVDEARAGWDRESERRIRRAREEAEMAARMDADARLDERFAEREAALDGREAEIRRRELRAGAMQALTQRGMPTELEAVLRYDSEEAVGQSLDALEHAFRCAVQQGIEQRMRGNVPTKTPMPAADVSDEDYYGARYVPAKAD